ncbi:centrosomal protein 20 isoform X3 [Lithobates pipiens]
MATVADLKTETGLSDIPLDRSFLGRELNFVEDANAQSVPILYGILSNFLYGHRGAAFPLENPTRRNFEGIAGQITKDTQPVAMRLDKPGIEDSYVTHGSQHR